MPDSSFPAFHTRSFQEHGLWIFYSVLSGLLAGLAATVFLVLLKHATEFRMEHSGLIWLLPAAGFAIGWTYHHSGKSSAAGTHLILDEIHDPQNVVPLRMAPLILASTLLTHLVGGSTGREGTAVQMGASLSDQLSKVFPIRPEERRILLVAGAGASFGAAIGAPIAGVLFGMEVIHAGRLRPFAVIECMIASAVAYEVTRLLHAPHSIFSQYSGSWFELRSFLIILGCGAVFGILARTFMAVTHLVERLQVKWVQYPPLRPFYAGVLLAALFKLGGLERYSGLGLGVIQNSFSVESPALDPVLKLLLTALTIGSGFKGGEFIPLVFMGATLGSALSHFDPGSLPLLTSVGFAAVFGAAAGAPLTCAVMAMELFGWKVAVYAVAGCFIGNLFSGSQTIYRSQSEVTSSRR
ncbi:MAG: chloride channel protein [Methylotenera sp.]|nr:chloride channel protein [Oligoflexia bacterium]